ncbi:MAG: ribonuclease HII [Gammaproteobacteria bacterium]|nr:ribonuclease HII [Gammaproteobacteria bacterium]
MARQLALGSDTLLAVAGVDEAGRGPLAGPVVAAAVILDDERPVLGLADSKRLTPAQRDRVARAVRTEARAFAVALAEPAEIDSINVLEASLLAMARAIAKLAIVPALVRVDGNQMPRYSGGAQPFEIEAVVRGDQSVPAISAASILAKVCRDRLMRRWHRRYPAYGFDQHKGYPTPAHIAALAVHGPCPIHRRTFGPVRDCLKVPS